MKALLADFETLLESDALASIERMMVGLQSPPAGHVQRTVGVVRDAREPDGFRDYVRGEGLALITRVAATCSCGWRSKHWLVGSGRPCMRFGGLWSGAHDRHLAESLWWRHLAHDVMPRTADSTRKQLARLQVRSHRHVMPERPA
ncbi:MAG TPA: hypothetical protein VGM88_12215 [Kofleriaceae bacterium]|jgi:hypothetical protein